MINILIKLYCIIPIVFFVVTILLVVNGNNKLKNYNECTGTIVRFDENTSELRVGTYENKALSPIVIYEVNGKSYEYIGNYYSTLMKEGQEVSVLYSKEDFSKATIKNSLYFAPAITGALALLFILPIIIYVILKSKGVINL